MGKKNWSKYEPIEDTGYSGSVKNDRSRFTFKETNQTTNYPHTTVDVDGDGNMIDYHHSESPKGTKFGLRQLVDSAIQVAQHLNAPSNSERVSSKEDDINQNGIDI